MLTAGADETFLVDELSADDAIELERRWTRGTFPRTEATSDALASVLASMEKAGALYAAEARTTPTLRYAVCAIGDAAHPVARALAAMTSDDATLVRVAPANDADLAVLVRASGPLLAVLDAAGPLAARPHLLLDVAYAHTLSLGPFVWPRRTACLGCFAGRIAHAWGDPDPPHEPRAARSVELAAAMALEQLRTFRDRGACPFLVERVVSLDLATLETRTDHVFRLPWCPRCQPSEERGAHGAGSFALPWQPGDPT